MAFTFINSGTNASSGASSLIINKPTNTADGDIMFALVVQSAGYPDSAPAGWNSLGQQRPSTYGYYLQLYYKIASSEGASYTWGFASSSKVKGTIATYRGGFNSTDPIDVVSNTAYFTNDLNLRAASMTVSALNSSLVFCGSVNTTSASTFTKPSVPTTDWAENYDGGDTGSDMWQTFHSMVWSSSGATGTINSVFSPSSVNIKGAFAVALNPEASGPANLKSYNTNLKANIKSINTNLIANVKSLNTNV